jgi:dipeptidyl aminopeptidase/acylaminoacyl peptidase
VIRLSSPGDDPASITRFGSPAPAPDGRSVYCVREREFDARTEHDLVRLATDGSGALRVVAQGHGFYGAPVPHPDGSALAFLTWDFPNMPWDESRLWEALLTETGEVRTVRPVAGGPGESITQPDYGPDGRLHFVADRTGWWNLYARQPSGEVRCLVRRDAEFGRAEWFCGRRTYGFAGEAGIVAMACRNGRDALIRIRHGSVEMLPVPLDALDFVATSPDGDVVVIGAAPDRAPAVMRVPVGAGAAQTLRTSWPAAPGPACISVPDRLAIRADDGQTVHALFYPPAKSAPASQQPPPLMVFCHGGPTVLASTALDIQVQFWTGRGFAVVAVNYRGSPGFGRAYRQSIRGRWGVLDVEDCLAVVRELVAAQAIDPERIVARGKSSGALTALRMAAAATRHGVRIAAVISASGVTDPADLPERTHKMESRYLDGLIGPWPRDRAAYESRSIFADLSALTTPVLLLHGTQDRVVPLEQAERLRRALVARGVRADLVTFDGEGHAIRRPENIRRMAQAELDFLPFAASPEE